MKQVFKCDYCNEMGTEEEIRAHEPTCFANYDRKSCFTCVHKTLEGINYKCKAGIEIPEGKIFEFCGSYERKERPKLTKNIFGDLFGFGL